MNYADEQKVKQTLERLKATPEGFEIQLFRPAKPRSRKPPETRPVYFTIAELIFAIEQFKQDADHAVYESHKEGSEADAAKRSLQTMTKVVSLCKTALKTIADSSDGVVKAYSNEILEKISHVAP